jgi:hypothetical protein
MTRLALGMGLQTHAQCLAKLYVSLQRVDFQGENMSLVGLETPPCARKRVYLNCTVSPFLPRMETGTFSGVSGFSVRIPSLAAISLLDTVAVVAAAPGVTP